MGYLDCLSIQVPRIPSHEYRGFAITSRTYQVRGSGQWAIDIVIGRWGSKRAFDTQRTADSEEEANELCWSLGRQIIDQSHNVTSLADLVGATSDLVKREVVKGPAVPRVVTK